MKLRFYVYLLFLVTVLSCREEEPQPPAPECEMDNSIDAMKRWYFFKEGSTWDYQDQFSGAVDHVVVSDYIEEYYANDRFYISSIFFSSYFNRHTILVSSDEGFVNWSNDVLCKRHLIKETREDINSYVFPIQVGESESSFGWILVDVYYDNNAGTNFQFPKVLRLIHPFYKLGDASAYTEIWIAEGVGVVRLFRPGQNEDWRLIDYQIVE